MATWSETVSYLVAEAQEERDREKAGAIESEGGAIVTPLKQKQAGGSADDNG